MFYREAGDFKTTYVDDSQTFPIKFDRWRYYAVLAVAFGVIPFLINDYWANAVFVPFLIYAIAAIGLNILTGYCGQVSLGTGGFMAVGAYACYKLMTAFPEVSILIHVLLAGGITAGVGVLFGLPSLAGSRASTWPSPRLPRSSSLSGSSTRCRGSTTTRPREQISAPERTVLGHAVTGAATTASLPSTSSALSSSSALAWLARNLTRGMMGRKWMAIRDMDIAAEIIGVNPLDDEAFGLCHLLLLYRRGGGPVLRGLSGRGRGGRGVRHPEVVPHPLHDHHRRAWAAIFGSVSRVRPSWCCCPSF